MSLLAIAITKGKASIEIETDDLPEDVYREALIQGLKVLLNRGMSKITVAAYSDKADPAAAVKEAAMVKAAENVIAVKAGDIKFTGSAKTKKVPGAVMTEARRLAKNLIKDAMKAQGIKISHVKASEITKAANSLLDDSPEIIAQAEANLAEREKAPIKIDLKALIKEDPELVAKAEARKSKKGTLSAKQAALPKKHKPAAQATA